MGFYGYDKIDVDPLVRAICAQGVLADSKEIIAGGGGGISEVLAIISIGGGIGLGELCKLFAGQFYDTRLREPLNRVLFKKDDAIDRKPRLEIQGTDLTACIDARTIADIDAGIALLPEALKVLSQSDVWRTAEKPMSPSLSYTNGTWCAHGRRAVYAYRAGTNKYEEMTNEELDKVPR